MYTNRRADEVYNFHCRVENEWLLKVRQSREFQKLQYVEAVQDKDVFYYRPLIVSDYMTYSIVPHLTLSDLQVFFQMRSWHSFAARFLRLSVPFYGYHRGIKQDIVALVSGINGDPVCLWKDDSQEHISPAMNTILLLFHFPFFKFNINILGIIFFISFPFTSDHFCINVHYYIGSHY